MRLLVRQHSLFTGWKRLLCRSESSGGHCICYRDRSNLRAAGLVSNDWTHVVSVPNVLVLMPQTAVWLLHGLTVFVNYLTIHPIKKRLHYPIWDGGPWAEFGGLSINNKYCLHWGWTLTLYLSAWMDSGWSSWMRSFVKSMSSSHALVTPLQTIGRHCRITFSSLADIPVSEGEWWRLLCREQERGDQGPAGPDEKRLDRLQHGPLQHWDWRGN